MSEKSRVSIGLEVERFQAGIMPWDSDFDVKLYTEQDITMEGEATLDTLHGGGWIKDRGIQQHSWRYHRGDTGEISDHIGYNHHDVLIYYDIGGRS